jgi:hypothetical protein
MLARRVEGEGDEAVGGSSGRDSWDEWGPPPLGLGYEIGVVCLFVRLVLAGVSLRGTSKALGLMAEAFGLPLEAPHWTTGRLWLLRVGHFVLTRSPQRAGDWVLLVDHSVKLGKQRVLLVVGLRLKDLPPPGQCLRYRDLHLLALEMQEDWSQVGVGRTLERVAALVGKPRQVVSDYASDLRGGLAILRQSCPGTAEVYDTKHKAACLLKGRLEKDPRWQEFQRQVAQARRGVQQTELAFLAPPTLRAKARFMNLGPLLVWAGHVLSVVLRPPPAVTRWVTPQRLEEKLGWLRSFAEDLAEWSRWQRVVDEVVGFVASQGLSLGCADELGARLSQLDVAEGPDDSTRRLATELEQFVREQEAAAGPGERLVGSTEVLESCFGKFKNMEKQQSHGGFTSLVLAFGAMLAETSPEVIYEALAHSSTKDVLAWCKENLGTTLFAQRKAAYAAAADPSGATESR